MHSTCHTLRPLPLVAAMLAAVCLMTLACRGAPDEGTAGTATTPPAAQPTNIATARPAVATVATGLEVPWALDFMPDGGIIFTERPGRVRLISAAGELLSTPLLAMGDVAPVGEGGLLGLALHPDFTTNGLVYLYYTYRDGPGLANRLVRYTLQDNALAQPQALLSGIPGAGNHDGGRIKFGPDGTLFIATGDASNSSSAQDRDSLSGKILRLLDDGSIPPDNPFPGSPVYTLGHRNPEGIAWDSQGRMWATEHGSTGTDELNFIQAGRNYGWPSIRGDQEAAGIESPAIHSGGNTWAPSGLAFLGGSLYFAGLRGEQLYRVSLGNPTRIADTYLAGQYGRLRAIVAGPDGFLYVTTSNRDGRGSPTAADDRILKLDPATLP